MTLTTRILQLLGIGVLIFNFAACSGGGGEEPLDPQQATTEPPDTNAPPTNPPEPTEPPGEPTPPATPPTNPPSTPPPTTPPTRPPTTPPPTVPPPTPRPPVTRPPTTPPVVEPPPPPAPTGMYKGRTADGRTIVSIVRPNRQTWFVLSVTGLPEAAEGLIVGTMSSQTTTWAVENATMKNLESDTQATMRGTGNWAHRNNLRGQFTAGPVTPADRELRGPGSVDMAYQPISETPINLSAIAGHYEGFIPPYEFRVKLDINSDGTITGQNLWDCTFSGRVVPNGSVAEGSITFRASPEAPDAPDTTFACPRSTQGTVNGILTVDSFGQLIFAGASSDRESWWAFIGQR